MRRGPKKKKLSAQAIEKLAKLGLFNNEIAHTFDVSTDTLERNYAADLFKGRLDRKNSLRRAQFRYAERGNPALLIFLGKQYLGQSDKSLDEHILKAIDDAGISKEDLLELITNKDQAARALPKRSFKEFVEKAGYPAPFDKQIEMSEFATCDAGARILLGARGIGKTDYCTILGIAYAIYLRPDTETNLIITKSKERNAAIIREIQKACESNGVMFEIANSVTLRVFGLKGKDNSVSAVTIKTVSFRGRHPKRVTMDDPVTEDDVSPATRRQVQKVWNEVNKLSGNIIVIGQPAHQQDLYAKLRDVIKTMLVPHGSIPELDHDLQAQRLAGVDEASISASYHLKVLTEGTAPFENVKYMEVWPTGGTSIAFIDPSHKGKDFTGLSVIKQHMQGVAVAGYCWRKAWNHCLDDIVPILVELGVKRVCIETNGLGDQPVELLRGLLKLKGIGVVGKDSVLNKHAKIMAAGNFAHMIHLVRNVSAPAQGPARKQFIDQTVQYEYNAENDDGPDSLASGLEWIGLIRGKR